MPRLIDVISGRFTDLGSRYYRPDWTPLDVKAEYALAPVLPEPPDLEEMLDIALRIGKQFDFMRIDLYHSRGQVWFGKTPPIPGAASTPSRRGGSTTS